VVLYRGREIFTLPTWDTSLFRSSHFRSSSVRRLFCRWKSQPADCHPAQNPKDEASVMHYSYTVLSSSFNCSGGQLKRSAVLLSNFNPKHILDPKLRRVDSQKQRLLSWSRAVIACKPSNSPCPCSFIAILAKRSTLRDLTIIRNCANLLTERFLVTSLGNGQLF
jgi:hypothetical protein